MILAMAECRRFAVSITGALISPRRTLRRHAAVFLARHICSPEWHVKCRFEDTPRNRIPDAAADGQFRQYRHH